MTLHVTGHAIARYQERVANVSTETARAALSTPAIEAAAMFGARSVRLGTGHRVARIGREERLRFTDAMADLERRALDQTAIDALPEKWKAIAAEKCFLWRWPDGRFTRRADMERLSEDAQAAERERLAAMFAEWAGMAEQAAGSAAA